MENNLENLVYIDFSTGNFDLLLLKNEKSNQCLKSEIQLEAESSVENTQCNQLYDILNNERRTERSLCEEIWDHNETKMSSEFAGKKSDDILQNDTTIGESNSESCSNNIYLNHLGNIK